MIEQVSCRSIHSTIVTQLHEENSWKRIWIREDVREDKNGPVIYALTSYPTTSQICGYCALSTQLEDTANCFEYSKSLLLYVWPFGEWYENKCHGYPDHKMEQVNQPKSMCDVQAIQVVDSSHCLRIRLQKSRVILNSMNKEDDIDMLELSTAE